MKNICLSAGVLRAVVGIAVAVSGSVSGQVLQDYTGK